EGVGADDGDEAEAQGLGPQDQEGVGEVDQPEQSEKGDHRPERPRQPPSPPRSRQRISRIPGTSLPRTDGVVLPHEPAQGDAGGGGRPGDRTPPSSPTPSPRPRPR